MIFTEDGSLSFIFGGRRIWKVGRGFLSVGFGLSLMLSIGSGVRWLRRGQSHFGKREGEMQHSISIGGFHFCEWWVSVSDR